MGKGSAISATAPADGERLHEGEMMIKSNDRRISPVLAVAVAGALAFAACGGDDDDDDAGSESGTDTPSEESEPTEGSSGTEETAGEDAGVEDDGAPATDQSGDEDGGAYDLDATLNVTVNGPPSELDPHLEPHSGTQMYWTPLYDTLTNSFSTGTPEPNIATEWSRSDDGLTWTFTLRDDVTFHDGTPLDAAAVVASIDRARSHPDSTVAVDLDAIDSVEASGDYEVTINANRYDPKLPTILGGPAGAILNPVAIESGNDFSTTPDGSGPYVLTELVPEVSASYERAPTTYWHPDGGRLAGFNMSLVDNFQTAVNGVRAGQYDVAWVLGSSELVEDALAADDSLQEIAYPPASVQALYINVTEPRLSDERVRQAISYSIDRQSLTDAIFYGGADCAPSSQNYPFEGEPLYIEGYDPYPYDVEQAQALIAEAGAEGTDITVYDIGATQSVEIAQAIQPMLEEIGLNVTVQNGTPEVTAEYRADAIDSMVVTNVAQAHPLQTLTRYWVTGGAYHSAAGQDDELLRLTAEVEDPATSAEEADAVYDDMAREMARLSTIIPVCAATAHVLADGNVDGLLEGQNTRVNMRFVGVRAD